MVLHPETVNMLGPAIRTAVTGFLIAVLVLPVGTLLHEAKAGDVYTYTDENGTVVVTDNRENVPKRFRRSVKVMRVKDVSGEPVVQAPAPAAERKEGFDIGGRLAGLMDLLPDQIVSGLSKRQSVLLIGGFLAGVVAFGVMTMTRSASIRFAMKWVLFFVGFGVMYAMYFTQLGADGEEPGNIMQSVTTDAAEIEQIHDQRARQLDELTR